MEPSNLNLDWLTESTACACYAIRKRARFAVAGVESLFDTFARLASWLITFQRIVTGEIKPMAPNRPTTPTQIVNTLDQLTQLLQVQTELSELETEVIIRGITLTALQHVRLGEIRRLLAQYQHPEVAAIADIFIRQISRINEFAATCSEKMETFNSKAKGPKIVLTEEFFREIRDHEEQALFL